MIPQSEVPKEVEPDSNIGASSKGRKGKKRAREYEGDEQFRINREIMCPEFLGGATLITRYVERPRD